MPASQPGRASWPSNDDTTLVSLAIILGGLGFFGWLLWSNDQVEISTGFVQAAHWHIQALQGFTHALDDLDARMLAADPARMSFGKLWEVSGAIGGVLRWPAALLLAALGVLCFFRAAPARFTRAFDLQGLRREQAKTFRTTAAYIERHLGLVPPRDGEPRPADPALHPDEWIARYATAAGGDYDTVLANAELSRQLGPLWLGVDRAAGHVRVLYAVFALHLAQRRPASLALLGDMAEALATPEPGEGPGGPEQPLLLPPALARFADEVLRDPDIADPARTLTARHGYTAPALMTLLTEARRHSGVLAPAQFNSLKLVDRRLWYALHSLGFPAEGLGQHPHPNPLVEAIGARDHWAAECLLGAPLFLPSVERAALSVRAAAGDAADVTPKEDRP